MDIEELARRDPGGARAPPHRPAARPLRLPGARRRGRGAALAARTSPGGTGRRQGAGRRRAARCGALYRERDATLVEVNPLVLTDGRRGRLPRQQGDHRRQRPLPAAGPRAATAAGGRTRGQGPRGGPRVRRRSTATSACIGNGAGLVMSTIDQIAAAGGTAADFCDIGGGARAEVVAAALDAIVRRAAGRRRARQHLRRHHPLRRGRRAASSQAFEATPAWTCPSSCASTATPPRRAAPCSPRRGLPGVTVAARAPDEAVRARSSTSPRGARGRAPRPAGGDADGRSSSTNAAACSCRASPAARAPSTPARMLRRRHQRRRRRLARARAARRSRACPSSTPSREAVARDRRRRRRALRAGALRARRHDRGRRRRHPPRRLRHRGHPGARHGRGHGAPARAAARTLIGPNWPGLITPGALQRRHHAGRGLHARRRSASSRARARSPTRSSTSSRRPASASPPCVGMGGDPVHGVGFIECLELLRGRPRDRGASCSSARSAATTRSAPRRTSATRMSKPVVAYVAGFSAPPGKRMGHAGAIVEGASGTAADKKAALEAAGIPVAAAPARASSPSAAERPIERSRRTHMTQTRRSATRR